MQPLNIEIGQYVIIDKGNLRASFTLLIHPFGQKILDCKHFVTSTGHWWKMPAFKAKDRTGKDTFFPFISYLDKTYDAALKEAVSEALKTKLEKPYESVPNKIQANPLQSEPPPVWF